MLAHVVKTLKLVLFIMSAKMFDALVVAVNKLHFGPLGQVPLCALGVSRRRSLLLMTILITASVV